MIASADRAEQEAEKIYKARVGTGKMKRTPHHFASAYS